METTKRETKKIILPISKKEVEYLTYITARERRQLLSASSLVKDEDMSARFENENITFELLTVSFDSSSENKAERMLELHQNDYKVIDKAYAEIISGEDFLAEKKN